MNNPATFSAYVVTKSANGQVAAAVSQVPLQDLPPGKVLVRVAYSSLNYKDALAATGHPGVTKKFPHIPGIDAAGEVVESADARFTPGQLVIVTGHELGGGCWGGYAEFIRVPAEWVVPLPQGLSLRESMILGTAGFTAAQCVDGLVGNGISPDRGEIVVTGASGGVGSWAIAILAKLGFQVAAVSGKPSAHDYLKNLGATRILSREQVDDPSGQPLLKGQWSGAVDTVGGTILVTLVRSLQQRGCVTACGMTAGTDLPLTVFPFILRGVRLVGIDSAWCPADKRLEIWHRLATDWKSDHFDQIAQKTIGLSQLGDSVRDILAGQICGRIVVKLR